MEDARASIKNRKERNKYVGIRVANLTAFHTFSVSTATNATSHEKMFTYLRRSFNKLSLPIGLTKPGPVLMKNHVRAIKFGPKDLTKKYCQNSRNPTEETILNLISSKPFFLNYSKKIREEKLSAFQLTVNSPRDFVKIVKNARYKIVHLCGTVRSAITDEDKAEVLVTTLLSKLS
ncbi:hypothetical protein CDAR_608821 [Caerostris darwini]|uniref:Uncharacterized protein n=1 Tax=Caerostris darwini TaxID=1538125 RepID=A0AAV4WLS1_9ARAC|nr:hypothetical protein CDAR_608821 [Caerostris darwini]